MSWNASDLSIGTGALGRRMPGSTTVVTYLAWVGGVAAALVAMLTEPTGPTRDVEGHNDTVTPTSCIVFTMFPYSHQQQSIQEYGLN